jgi:hypothetical protein
VAGFELAAAHPSDGIMGLAWLDRVVHPDDRERTLQCWQAACEDRGDYDLEYRAKRRFQELRSALGRIEDLQLCRSTWREPNDAAWQCWAAPARFGHAEVPCATWQRYGGIIISEVVMKRISEFEMLSRTRE